MASLIGTDIGGTFTDVVHLDEKTGQISFSKVLTNYSDPTDGIVDGISEIIKKNNLKPKEISRILHGTTLVTNAVIERRGVKTGLITTLGFEDVLEIGREMRYDIYDLNLRMPTPLVPRFLRKGIEERVSNKGELIQAVDESNAVTIVEELLKHDVEAIAVCLLFSYLNPDNENKIKKIINKNFPNLPVCISSDILPEIREFERASTAAMNAYVLPITEKYLTSLEKKISQLDIDSSIQIMLSSGRLTTIDGAKKSPVEMLESGPAGGSMAGVHIGKQIGQDSILTFDMGGTTAKASLINQFKPEVTNQFEAGRVKRFRKGSGLPVRIPVIEMIEIGAGGGSIAYVDELGLLKVGPKSAGSEPGPVCYDKGGVQPTVTDADLTLGYLDENFFLGGTMNLNKEKAEEIIDKEIAQKLNVTVEKAAAGIHRIVSENMANAARVHILEKGYDPRSFSMIAFGGAGPVHAYQVAKALNIPQIIIPIGAGVASALGFLMSPIATEQIRSMVSALKKMNWDEANSVLQELEDMGKKFLTDTGLDAEFITVERYADMRYLGQGHEINVKIPNGNLDSGSISEISKNFEKVYEQQYGRILKDMQLELVTWRVAISGPTVDIQTKLNLSSSDKNIIKGYRDVWFEESQKKINCPVYDRYSLQKLFKANGPAIIEENESTFIIGPSASFRVDNFYNIIADLKNG